MRIAIVVQRYGEEVLGGAEDAARSIAEHLTKLGDVHVITTCALEYTTWDDHYPAGITELNGVTVHRFPVDEARDWQQAQKETGRFLLRSRTLDEEIDWTKKNGPYSPTLLQYIKQTEPDFDAFIFFTYVYATTFFGLPLVAHKAILVSTAHDEPFLYMDSYRSLFQLPRHIIYLTDAERIIVNRVTNNNHIPHTIAAMGIDKPNNISAEHFRHKFDVTDPYLLYGGRIATSKNIPELLTFFQRYKKENNHPLKLVLMGKSNIDLPQHPDIIPIGFVSEQDKFNALSGAMAVIQPSKFESLSIIILQGWLLGTPAIVSGQCAVTKQQCRRSHGGLYYSHYEEFAFVIAKLQKSDQLRTTLGEQGRSFTIANYSWDHIINQYESIIDRLKIVQRPLYYM